MCGLASQHQKQKWRLSKGRKIRSTVGILCSGIERRLGKLGQEHAEPNQPAQTSRWSIRKSQVALMHTILAQDRNARLNMCRFWYLRRLLTSSGRPSIKIPGANQYTRTKSMQKQSAKATPGVQLRSFGTLTLHFSRERMKKQAIPSFVSKPAFSKGPLFQHVSGRRPLRVTNSWEGVTLLAVLGDQVVTLTTFLETCGKQLKWDLSRLRPIPWVKNTWKYQTKTHTHYI